LNRWGIISLVILLSQGLVFQQDGGTSMLPFEILIFLMIFISFGSVVYNSYVRKLSSKEKILVSRQSLALLDREEIMNLFLIRSIAKFLKNKGLFDFDDKELLAHLKKKVYNQVIKSSESLFVEVSNAQVIVNNLPGSLEADALKEVLNYQMPAYHQIDLTNSSPPSMDENATTRLSSLEVDTDRDWKRMTTKESIAVAAAPAEVMVLEDSQILMKAQRI
jgi:hypothetical protein